MSAKKLLAAALIASLLSACGGNPTQALPGDGSYDDTVLPADDYGYGADGIGGDPATGGDPYGSGTGTTGTDPLGTGDGQIGDPTGQGFTLRGLVADQLGQPLAGAKVSIGAQTTLTSATGEFEITGIMDSQVWVDVSKSGFETISRFNVLFTNDKPTADKEFKLAPSGSGSTDGGTDGTTDGGSTSGPTLSHEGTFGGPTWKSVAGMAVDGNRVYVLGKIDKKLWFDRSAVVVFDASSGEEISRIGDVMFSKVPKAASSIKIEDGEVIVSDGSVRATFDASGSFVQKTSGGGFDAKKTAIDGERGITYALKSGNKVAVDSRDFDGELRLEDVGNAKAIGLDDDGNLLVLDDSQKAVHMFSFE